MSEARPSLLPTLRLLWARYLDWTGQRLDRKIAHLDRRARECYELASKHREKTYARLP